MIKIAICDDQQNELEYCHQLINTYLVEYPQYDIKVDTFIAPLELLMHVEKHGGFDLVFLDIYMDGIMGIDVAKQLRKLKDKCEIIFLTSSKKHSLDAYEVDAAQYLIKPYSKSAFFSAFDKVLGRLNSERRHLIIIKSSAGIVRLYTRNVVFTETGRNNYQIIHMISGEKIEVRMTSSELLELLQPTSSFVKCGSSLNVNLRFIRQIKKDVIVFDSGEQLSYPYRSHKKLKEDFLSFKMQSEN